LTSFPKVEAILEDLVLQMSSLKGSEAWQRAAHLLPKLLTTYREKGKFMEVSAFPYKAFPRISFKNVKIIFLKLF
jgi:hypothetical protein